MARAIVRAIRDLLHLRDQSEVIATCIGVLEWLDPFCAAFWQFGQGRSGNLALHPQGEFKVAGFYANFLTCPKTKRVRSL